MSADSLHHSVEKSLKKAGKVYDFDDFVMAVRSAKSGRNFVKPMECTDFYDWADNCSKVKLNNKKFNLEYPYLDKVRKIFCERGMKTLKYKNSYRDEEEWKTMDFLKRPSKNATDFTRHEKPCGIPQSKKDDILMKLGKIMPADRRKFWENIPISAEDNIE